MIKPYLCFALIITLLLSMCVGAAATGPAIIEVSDGTAVAGEKAELTVSVLNSPGVSGAALTVSYDKSSMSLEDIQPLVDGSFMRTPALDGFSWLKGRDVEGEFELVRLIFNVDNKASGQYEVGIKLTGDKPGNLTNQDAEAVAASFSAGILTVEGGQESPLPDGGGGIPGGGIPGGGIPGGGGLPDTGGDDETGHDCPASEFSDVNLAGWYHTAIDYVLNNGIMNGMGGGLFAPGESTTRAMIVTTLYRIEGEPAVNGKNSYSDVKNSVWYTDAIIWATEKGIVNGYGGGKFGPQDLVTREQIAAILYRYAFSEGLDVSQRADLSKYIDAGSIHSWAYDAMSWANAEGLMMGRSANTLVPGGTAMRSEVATLLMRWCEDIAA